jgi:hypothetical protein
MSKLNRPLNSDTSIVTKNDLAGFKMLAEIECAFCGGHIGIGINPDEGRCAVHTMPPCREYLDKELIEFLIENRRKHGIPDPPKD